MKEITKEMKDLLNKPLPAEAVQEHPSKKFLSTIKAIYVTERLNDVFGVGAWQTKVEYIERVDKMVVIKTTLTIPEYGISYECYGGNDNADLGDAYKGATTDAITKIGSYLGIGIDVFKGKQTHKSTQNKPQVQPTTTQPKVQQGAQKQPIISEEQHIKDCEYINNQLARYYEKYPNGDAAAWKMLNECAEQRKCNYNLMTDKFE